MESTLRYGVEESRNLGFVSSTLIPEVQVVCHIELHKWVRYARRIRDRDLKASKIERVQKLNRSPEPYFITSETGRSQGESHKTICFH